jgi:hypothetical protein
MALRCAVVIRGASRPRLVLLKLLTSSTALVCGVWVPMPTCWACMKWPIEMKRIKEINLYILPYLEHKNEALHEDQKVHLIQ